MFASLYEMFRSFGQVNAEQAAFRWVDTDGVTLREKTYADYARDVARLAGKLRAAGDPAGRHYGILAGDGYGFAVCLGGIWCAGGVAVLLNRTENAETVCGQLTFADVEVLFADEENAARVAAFCAQHGIVLCDAAAPREGEAVLPDPVPEENRPALLLFTSGSSGRSKCVMLSARNLLYGAGYVQRMLQVAAAVLHAPSERYISMLPLFHVMGCSFLFDVLALRRTVHLWDIRHLQRDARLLGGDCIGAVPAVVEAWSAMPAGTPVPGGVSLIVCGGASTDAGQPERLEQAGAHLVFAYALSESGGIGPANMFAYTKKAGAVGKIVAPGTEIRLAEDGEICLRGESVMLGYYKDEAATREVLRDGWLHTGDLGRFDADGDLFVTGRKKNLIVLSNGENVSPEELEAALCGCPAVREAMVAAAGGALCAHIVCDEAEQAAVTEYVGRWNRTQPLWKQITRVEFCAALPRTATGKLRRG